MDKEPLANQYQKQKLQLFFVGLALDIVFLLILSFGGGTFIIKQWALAVAQSPFFVIAAYTMILLCMLGLLHFPLQVYKGFILEHKFNLSKQTFSQWFVDSAKIFILSGVFGLILIEGLYMFLSRYPQTWWMYATGFWLFVSFVVAKLVPVFFVPLFFKYIPIENHELKTRIFSLFKVCNAPLDDIYSIDMSRKTKKANAFICGIGKNRRVVLSDTLIDNFSDEEIEAVVAHELGHYKHRDILKGLCVNTVTIFIGFFIVHQVLANSLAALSIGTIDDIAALPMLILTLTLFQFCTAPILNGFSRWIEIDADRYSLEITKRPKEFISMMQKLAKMNLAKLNPGRLEEIFFYDHPPIAKRIAFAREYE